MATDTRQTNTRQPKHPLTVADLCAAIADEKVPFTTRDGEYHLSALDLRRMERTSEDGAIPVELLAELGNLPPNDSLAH